MIDQSFQGVNILFVLTFNDDEGRESYKQYYFPTAEIKDYSVMIDGRNFFDQPIKNDLKIYDNIRTIATGQGDDYTIGCLLDYPYFKSKQQKFHADTKAIQEVSFTENLSRAEGARIYVNIELAKEWVLDFSKGTVKVLWFFFCLNIILI